jgi:hypothetical protein
MGATEMLIMILRDETGKYGGNLHIYECPASNALCSMATIISYV